MRRILHIILSVFVFGLFISCSNSEDIASVLNNTKAIYSEIQPIEPLDSIIHPWGNLLIPGQTVVLPNGWLAYADEILIGVEPINPEIVFYETVFQGELVDYGNGFQFIFCPTAGNNCGHVYDITEKNGKLKIRFIGYYID